MSIYSTKGRIFNIQRFSIHDGPGIRTIVFLKGCALRCPWCHNPETISPKSQELFFEQAGRKIRYGTFMPVDEVLQELLEDQDFYVSSRGGVTVSGGEPLLQCEAVAELFIKLKQLGISTLIDTAGDVPWEKFDHIKSVTDIFYFDFKTGSDDDYSKVIGGSGPRIYENLRRLIAEGSTVHVRIPLIPGFNTSAECTLEICKKLQKAGVQRVDLLPFHRLGSSKYTAMGKEYAYRDTLPQSAEEIERLVTIYQEYFSVKTEM